MKLKPCPFCGIEDAEIYADGDWDYYIVECCNCDSVGPGGNTKEEAIKSWNTRPFETKELDNA